MLGLVVMMVLFVIYTSFLKPDSIPSSTINSNTAIQNTSLTTEFKEDITNVAAITTSNQNENSITSTKSTKATKSSEKSWSSETVYTC